MSEAQQLQNDMGTKLVRDTARATVAEARLATDIAIPSSLEGQLRSLRCSYNILLREPSSSTSSHTPLTDRDQQFPNEFQDISAHPATNDFQGPYSQLPISEPTPSPPTSGPSPAQCSVRPQILPPPPPPSGSVLTPSRPVPCTASIPPQVVPSRTAPRIKEVKCETLTGKDNYPGVGASFDLSMHKFK